MFRYDPNKHLTFLFKARAEANAGFQGEETTPRLLTSLQNGKRLVTSLDNATRLDFVSPSSIPFISTHRPRSLTFLFSAILSSLSHAARIREHDPLQRLAYHPCPPSEARPPPHALPLDIRAPPASRPLPRPLLVDASNDAGVSERISSSSRATGHGSAYLARKAAAIALPRKTARKPIKANTLGPSPFPHVPADRRVLLWTAPYSAHAHSALQEQKVPLNLRSSEGR
ncbi:hypothetical protein B0H13DRAFT_2317282 [Mycena leptocephala]|nr:hypothetical protein B0H13DRAFT_2317282 [Mycena leptocephala]